MQDDDQTQAINYLEQRAAMYLTYANQAPPTWGPALLERAAEHLRAANVAKASSY